MAEPRRRWMLGGPGMVAGVFLATLVVVSLAAPLVTCPAGREHQHCGRWLEHPHEQLRGDGGEGRLLVSVAPGAGRPLGTDELGRDVLSRVVHGARGSLLVGSVAGALVALLGTLVGAVAGYRGGRIDQMLMRFTDLVLALPLLPLAIVAGRMLPDLEFLPRWMAVGPAGLAVLLGSLLWGPLARMVRAELLALREREFVEAARAVGAGHGRILFRHLVPNASGPIVVQTTLIVGAAITLEAALSFLGFGVRPPAPTWGGMTAAGALTAPQGAWWELTFAAGALVATVLAVNSLGDGLRAATGSPPGAGRVW